MPGLVVRDDPALLFVEHPAFALQPSHRALNRLFQLGHGDGIFISPRCQKGRFIDDIGQVRTGKTRSTHSQFVQIYIRAQLDFLGVDLEDGGAPLDIGPVHGHGAVEAAGAQQGRVEDFRPVGRRHEDHAGVGVETVEFGEELIERLLALVVPAKRASPPGLAQGVELVDEDNGRGVFFGLFKKVAHARGSYPDEHLDKIGAAKREKGHARLASDGLGQQGLTRAR